MTKAFAGTYSEETGYIPGRSKGKAHGDAMRKAYKKWGAIGMKKTLEIIKQSRYLQQIRANVEEGIRSEEDDPKAYEAVGIILQIMRGDIRGRHLTARLAAARAILEQYRGLPKRQIEHDITDTFAELIEKADQRANELGPQRGQAVATGLLTEGVREAVILETQIDDHAPTGDHDETQAATSTLDTLAEVPDSELAEYL